MQNAGYRYRAAFITVTYRPEETWDAGDVRTLVKHYRQWAARRGVRLGIVWVAETHGGGRNHGQIHYHLVIFVPRGLTPPMPDKQGWWRKGMSNCKWSYRPVGYMAKYASKGLSGPPMPRGARLWGVSGLGVSIRARLALALAPKWLRDFCQPDEIVKRIAHGWWRNCTTGWEYRTPWEFEWGPEGPGVRWREARNMMSNINRISAVACVHCQQFVPDTIGCCGMGSCLRRMELLSISAHDGLRIPCYPYAPRYCEKYEQTMGAVLPLVRPMRCIWALGTDHGIADFQ